jgi:DNA-directed RNA polymerase specialized sigma24 family protein
MADGSVTRWVDQLRAGDPDAAGRLWDAYFRRMVEVAARGLGAAPRLAADEEDVALSAFKSFCLGAQEGRFPQISDRENLWPLLVALTRNKCVDLVRHETRKKRGGGAGASRAAADFEQVIGREPTPEFVAQLSDLLAHLLARLDGSGDPTLRSVAVWKLEGESTEAIAGRLGTVRRTVERKIALIARIWEDCDVPAKAPGVSREAPPTA